jgi:agmatinase
MNADIVILGVPLLSPHKLCQPTTYANELKSHSNLQMMPPTLIRNYSPLYSDTLHNYDFALKHEAVKRKCLRVVDCGNMEIFQDDHIQNGNNITNTIREIVNKGTIPLILGGDHAITIPVLESYSKVGPLCVVHIDAHIDFLDKQHGYKNGCSCCMRRASEMPWVSSIVHFGIRGLSSASIEDVKDDLSMGNIVIRAEDLYRQGIEKILTLLPKAEKYYVSIDADGFDPSVAPAVFYPSPGGLSYHDFTALFNHIASMGKIVGVDLNGIIPDLDLRNLTSIFAGRIILHIINTICYQNYI